MAARKPRMTQDDLEAAEAAVAEASEELTEPAPLRALVVTLDAEGNLNVQNHGINSLEAPTLLRLAAKSVEKTLGLER